jgi:hypothetical protein
VSSVEQPRDLSVEAWKAKWPNWCRACNGWGALDTGGPDVWPAVDNATQKEREDAGFVDCWTKCEVRSELKCHRCSGEFPASAYPEKHWCCNECGWSFDDGI